MRLLGRVVADRLQGAEPRLLCAPDLRVELLGHRAPALLLEEKFGLYGFFKMAEYLEVQTRHVSEYFPLRSLLPCQ